MSAQTSYNQATPRGVAGGIYDISDYDIISRINENENGVMAFGMGVVVGTSKGEQVKVPEGGATLKDFEGVAVNGFSTELDMDGNLRIGNNSTVGVMTNGKIWVRLKAEINPKYGDSVYLITDGENAGLFSNVSEEETSIEITGAKFIGTKGTGDIAPIELK